MKATITLSRNGNVSAASSVMLTATGGSATAGPDFGAVPTTVNFDAGTTTATVLIPIVNDAAFDGPGTLLLTLSAPTGGEQLDPALTNTTQKITDDEVGAHRQSRQARTWQWVEADG